ncbi:CvpA family protein [Rhodoblastus sp.]|uniref:CvpA family protein n=1 Tax=Rhodoblastus sp. TaxID=1962975 RepID=UPI00263916AB|nr:CvpA family protein [Rhodoblastus sp.]
MPSYLDLGVIAVIAVSAILAMIRGFTREIMAIFSWAAAAAAAVYFYPLLLPKLADPSSPIYIGKEALRPYAAGAAIFFVALIVVSIITIRISDAILDSKIGPLDRSLGFLFGAVRGLLLCAIAFIFFNWLAPEATNTPSAAAPQRNQWLANARSLPLLKATSDQLLALLPDDPEGLLAKLKKPKAPPSDEAPPPESDSEPKAAPATPSPSAATPSPPPRPGKVDNALPPQDDKQKLDKILNLGR